MESLTVVLILGLVYLLLNGPRIQSESCWHVCHFCSLKVRVSCWSSLWLTCLIARKGCLDSLVWSLCDTFWSESLKEAFGSDPAQLLWVLWSQYNGVFSNRDLPFTSGGPPPTTACNILGVYWITLTNGLITGFSCLVRFLLDSLWFWQGALSVQMGKFHLNYECVCIQNLYVL